jgi:hypothetical protein
MNRATFPDEGNFAPFAGCSDGCGSSWVACRAVKCSFNAIATGKGLDLGNVLLAGGKDMVNQTKLLCQFNASRFPLNADEHSCSHRFCQHQGG